MTEVKIILYDSDKEFMISSSYEKDLKKRHKILKKEVLISKIKEEILYFIIDKECNHTLDSGKSAFYLPDPNESESKCKLCGIVAME